jgi:NAD(P)-dependent dehydrogenase (short-subunit alcohol dehydrogenase family)
VSSVREVARKAVELGNGHVDILINNVGLFPFGPTQQTTEEMFDSLYSPNVKAPYFLVGELAPLMASRGKGANVNGIDDGRRLRGVGHEPLWLEQGRHQSSD